MALYRLAWSSGVADCRHSCLVDSAHSALSLGLTPQSHLPFQDPRSLDRPPTSLF